MTVTLGFFGDCLLEAALGGVCGGPDEGVCLVVAGTLLGLEGVG